MSGESLLGATCLSKGRALRGWLCRPGRRRFVRRDGPRFRRHPRGAPRRLRGAIRGRRVRLLVFDYRHFGASEGEPRQLLDVAKQLGDWRAAIAWTRAQPEIDAARVAIWGTSFSGGHVMSLGAEDAQLAAIVAQVPFCDPAPRRRRSGRCCVWSSPGCVTHGG
jgi:dienelactone hydrolase